MTTVAVAMSGGVDSSVAAALLLERDFQVIGITMQHMHDQMLSSNATADAKKVCKQLNIPHYSFDVKNYFSDTVIDNFIQEYISGRTPNPCVYCNAAIKWGYLFDKALSLGAGYFATGHYAHIAEDQDTHRMKLQRGIDRTKDQSYALWKLSQAQLKRTMFPLGGANKTEVREYARLHALETAMRPESQEICFIPNNNYRNFLSEALLKNNQNIQKGKIYDSQGTVLGVHDGYPFYTIGQRKGLGIALGHPMYVIKIDAERNRIVVGREEELYASGLKAENVNWVSVEKLDRGATIEAKIRYNDPGFSAEIHHVTDTHLQLQFKTPQRAVTPGQSVVVYRNDEVLCGGIITEKQ